MFTIPLLNHYIAVRVHNTTPFYRTFGVSFEHFAGRGYTFAIGFWWFEWCVDIERNNHI